MLYYKTFDSPIGTLTIAATDTHITGLWMENQKYFALPPDAVPKDTPLLISACQCLRQYFEGRAISSFSLPLLPKGTAFQLAVWDILQTIPYGKTVTYGQIADILAQKNNMAHMSAQAVGNAVGRNPISIFIPCHRVLGSNGQLTGYAGGIERKQFLIALEQQSKV